MLKQNTPRKDMQKHDNTIYRAPRNHSRSH